MTATKAPAAPKRWISGFCNPSNDAASHARCSRIFSWHDGPCCCTCHEKPASDLEETPVLVLPDGLEQVIKEGLRRCRHTDAPVPLINEADMLHIAHMVAEQVRAAGWVKP